MATYIKPNAIKDASIEGIKIKDGTISSSKIDGTVASKNYVDTQITEVGEGMTAMQGAFDSAYEALGTEINSLTEKTTSLDSRTPVDSEISFVSPWDYIPDYSEDVQDVQNYISAGFLKINNQMTSVDGLFNHIRDNNLAGKVVYFKSYDSYGIPSAAIIGNIDTGAVGYKISFSTISKNIDGGVANRLLIFEIEIGNLTGDGIIIMHSRLMNICIKDTLSQIDNNISKIQTLETKTNSLDSRTPVDSGIGIDAMSIPEYSTNPQDLSYYYFSINGNSIESYTQLHNYIIENDLAGKDIYFRLTSMGGQYSKILGHIDVTGCFISAYGVYCPQESQFISNGNFICLNIELDKQSDGTYILSPRGLLVNYNIDKIKENSNAVQITYAELKALRDAGNLVPGTQYRITDYTCTTSQANTRSAGHQFDIIVTADDASTLNEVARAVKHEGNEYFANSDLNAWKLWYCLDNDTNLFAWADSTNGKGVIYRMIDEWNNDVPYDFKNIQFYRQWDSSKSLWSNISSDNTGVPCYTFSSSGNSSTTSFTDMSLVASNNVYSNVIKKYVSSNKQTLNNDCFFGNSYYFNTFGNDCYSNTFGYHCYSNTFGNSCCYNTFGNSFYNTFGNYCYYNTFRDSCYYNTFGNRCFYNSFGNNCGYNTFGNDCSHINFASDGSAITKYNYYKHNHFGDGCQYILLKGTETASSSSQIQNYKFAQGLHGTDSSYLTIDGVRNRTYETYISKDTDGTVKESVIAEKLDKVIEISYNDLVTLRGSSKLVPGQQYRITDYTCTTSQANIRSAGHQFDIIVTADDENTLNEEARAINHKFDNPDDDYFKDCNLSAWKIWYSLDNDAARFAWAFFAELIGTIKPTTGSASGTYTYSSPISKIVLQDTVYTLEIGVRTQINIGPSFYITKTDDYTLVVEDTYNFVVNVGISVYTDSQEGKGVIYRMIDEFGNDCPYDFKNIQFYRKWDSSKSLWSTISSDNTGVPCYTFSSSGNSATTLFTDTSLLASNSIYSNVIKKYVSSNKQTLNNICFFGNNCYSNMFVNNCYNNTFGGYCYSNTFGNGCYNNTFGNGCSSNSFENGCYSNTFGNGCYNNTFGNGNINNTFGDGCNRNIFGKNCGGNTFGNYIQESQFGDSVQHFSITNKQMTTSPSSVDVKSYIKWLIVENGVRYVNAYVTSSTSSNSYCQNVRICLGVQGVNYNNNRKTFDITSCINSKLNNVYQPENSQTTNV